MVASSDGGGFASSTSTPALSIILASGGLLAFLAVSVCLVYSRRQRQQSAHRRFSAKSPLISHSPVVPLKAAHVKGPRGLKNATSPVQSPQGSEYSSSSSCSFHSPSELHPPQAVGGIRKLSTSQLGKERGSLTFSLHYDSQSSALQVGIIGCRDLPELLIAPDGQCLLDPYVKLQLLPEKEHRVKTRLVKATRNPVYDEQFTMYGIGTDRLATTSLHFAVVAFDRYSRDTVLAEAIYSLREAELALNEYKEVELTLGGRGSDLGSQRGEVLLSLCYQPTTSRVTVVILKIKDLPKFDITGMADPYVKIYMLYNGKRICKKKSQVKRRTLAPVYNESFVFDLPSTAEADLSAIRFEVSVLDWDRVARNEVMARCVIDDANAHWQQARQNPRRQIAEWHSLSG
uniref:C2 domain-containing protein n=1 Tax=Steinernema glaseri TaxID=37863 RepID=A0A1I7XZD6_9BILA